VRFGKLLWLLMAAFIFLAAGAQQGWALDPACGHTPWTLTTTSNVVVGTVTVCNGLNNVYVNYALTSPAAKFGNIQLWIGNSLLNMPQDAAGVPDYSKFCNALGGSCRDATNYEWEAEFQIPFPSTNIVDAYSGCGLPLYFVARTEIRLDTNGDGVPDKTEWAYAGNTRNGSKNNYWYYGTYKICCDFGTAQSPHYQTAFAKGGWVWTTDKKANPEGLLSLNLTQSRWGWAINLIYTGSTTYDIWAGAALNDTSKGVKVGTATVVWDGSTVKVTYNMFGGYLLQEAHVYAGDAKPTLIAPGQYGNLESFEPLGTSSYTFSLGLKDADKTKGVWLIIHGVVSSTLW
jgi:hypothetical protein